MPPRPWSQRVPHTDDPELALFLTRLAQAMDDRKDRIGEHLATDPEPWTPPRARPRPRRPA
jgi:hypothetical protein